MKIGKGFIIFVVISTVLMVSLSFYIYQIIYSPNILVGKEDRIVTIPKDANFRYIQDYFFDNDIAQDPVSFSFISRIMKYDENIKPGVYRLSQNSSNLETVRLLRSGNQIPVNITFNNARFIEDLAGKITQSISIDSVEFLSATKAFISSNEQWTNENILCMFIPNTYEVYWTITGDNLLRRMESEFNNFWTQARREKAKNLDLDLNDLCALASIVQAETKIVNESNRIAGLYLNRIDRNMYLQADPTLVYAANDFTIKRVLNEHKEIDSPYNTYMYKGLPPGPINLPEIWAYDAVLNFEDHSYIYMCAKEDFSGFHNFATNLSEHNENARRYQRALSIEMRKARINRGY